MRQIIYSLLLLLFLILPACEQGQQLTPLRPNDTILAFGDSLTEGVGAAKELSYPDQLARLIGRPVVNSGKAGELSDEGARRLPAVLDEVKPQLLILCHGGNDILQKRDRKQLKDNLRRLYEAANQRGIEVVMIAVPQLGIMAQDVPVYAELAEELKVPLLENALGELIFKREYKSDMVHLNAKGYRKLAEAVADLLQNYHAI